MSDSYCSKILAVKYLTFVLYEDCAIYLMVGLQETLEPISQ